jgi:hypothetical protein
LLPASYLAVRNDEKAEHFIFNFQLSTNLLTINKHLELWTVY